MPFRILPSILGSFCDFSVIRCIPYIATTLYWISPDVSKIFFQFLAHVICLLMDGLSRTEEIKMIRGVIWLLDQRLPIATYNLCTLTRAIIIQYNTSRRIEGVY